MEENDKRFNQKEVAEVVNDTTGMEVKVSMVQKRTPLPPNVMVFQTFAYLAATKLKPSTNKVLMMFFAESAYENFIGMDIETIAEKLSISRRTAVNALGELEKHSIIIKTPHPNDKRRNDYFLNPFATWKGNAVARKKMIESVDEKQLSLFDVLKDVHQKREAKEIVNGEASKILTVHEPISLKQHKEEY
jgi:DNA-binding MarR family transcriptional regulator